MSMKYEFMCIIKPFLPEDVRIKLQNSIKKIFIDHKGKISNEDIWGKRHLAYPISSHEEGYYVVYNIDIPANQVNEAKAELKLLSDILRFLFVKKD